VALNLEDVAIYPDGRLVVTVRRSKTDQEGEGREIAIPSGRTDATCAAKALGMWLELANITSGAIFRNVDRHGRVLDRLTPQSVALVVKNRSKDAGLDAKPYSGHSLRAGFATSAALAGVTELAIARQTGHKSTAMIKRYVRVADMWRDNAAERVGL
jgi:integrase